MFSQTQDHLQEARELFQKGNYSGSRKKLENLRPSRLSYYLESLHIRSPGYRSLVNATPEEAAKLAELNQKLSDIEKQLHQKIRLLGKQLNECGLECKHDITFTVYYYLSENDPTFDECTDNIIVESRDFTPHEDDVEINWNDLRSTTSPLASQHHCYMFHDLYDHTNPKLSLDDLLRIGEVGVAIKVRHCEHFQL